MPSRRELLAALGVASAGCLGDSATAPATDSSTTDGTSTADATESATGASTTSESVETSHTASPQKPLPVGESADMDSASVTVSNPRHRHSALTVQADTADVVTFDRRLVLVSVSATGTRCPPRSAFSLVSDGTRYDTFLEDGGGESRGAYRFYHLPDAYVPGEQQGWIGFELPVLTDSDADLRIAVEGDSRSAEWSLPSEVASALAAPTPRFELISFETPDSISTGEDPAANVTVKNTGGTGVFRGSVNTGGVRYSAEMFSFEVAGGATVTRDVFAAPIRSSGHLSLSLVGTDGISTDRRTLTVG